MGGVSGMDEDKSYALTVTAPHITVLCQEMR